MPGTEFVFPSPPRGWKALPWRLPILFYRLGLGSLLGSRFLLLNHTGRKTGQTRQAVLEIIQAHPELDQYTVVSGFGTQSHWYQNIKAHPRVSIQVGKRALQAEARQLEPELAAETIVAYANNHPGALKALASVLGYEIEHTPSGYREFGRRIPVIRFYPAGAAISEENR